MVSARAILALHFPVWLVGALAGGTPAAAGERFIRGDADASGQLEVTDAIRILELLFLENSGVVRCREAADTNDSGTLEVTDVIRILAYLFQQGPAPAPPFPDCGEDPTQDEIGCQEYGTCAPLHDVFGIAIPADAVFILIDRSGGMQVDGKLSLAQQEAEKVILAFSEKIQFGVLFFDTGLLKFPQSGRPAEANPDMKDFAVNFIQSTEGGRGTCPQVGLVAALQMAASASVRRKVILYMTDGGGTCAGADEGRYLQETLKKVAAANPGIARIYSLQMGVAGAVNVKYLRDLAAQSGGEYHVVPVR